MAQSPRQFAILATQLPASAVKPGESATPCRLFDANSQHDQAVRRHSPARMPAVGEAGFRVFPKVTDCFYPINPRLASLGQYD